MEAGPAAGQPHVLPEGPPSGSLTLAISPAMRGSPLSAGDAFRDLSVMAQASRADAPHLSYPYLKDAQGRYAPIVYLQVWTGNRWLYLQAYVDSGASWSVFHVDVAQLLGIKLKQAKRRYVSLGNGSVLPIYLKSIRVRFAGEEFTVPAGFSDALHMGFNLMGRAGFFTRFEMSFNDRARQLTVTRLTRARR